MFSLFSKYKNAQEFFLHKIKKHKKSVTLFTAKSGIGYVVVRFGDCLTCKMSSGSLRLKLMLAVDY